MNQKLKEVFRGKVVNKAHTINTGVNVIRGRNSGSGFDYLLVDSGAATEWRFA